MTLQQLIYFQTACKYQNISKAAEYLHVSQPSVSVAIKNLEEEFKMPLIQRSRSGFVLTGDGEEFLKLTEGLLEHAGRVDRIMKERAGKHALIRLGMPPMAGNILFPRIYGEFCPKHPDIQLVTQEAGRDDLCNMLKNDLLDMAFLPHGREVFPGYEMLKVADYEVVCCVSDKHPLAARKVITPKELEEESLVVFSQGFYHNELIFDKFKEAGVVPRVMHNSSQLSTVERLIADGVAVGFLFRELTEHSEGMTGIPFEPALRTGISLVWKKERVWNREKMVFAEFFKEMECE